MKDIDHGSIRPFENNKRIDFSADSTAVLPKFARTAGACSSELIHRCRRSRTLFLLSSFRLHAFYTTIIQNARTTPSSSCRCRYPRIPTRSPNPKHQCQFVENPRCWLKGGSWLLPRKASCFHHKGTHGRQIRKQIQSQLGQGLPSPRFQRSCPMPIPKKSSPSSYWRKGPCYVVPFPCIDDYIDSVVALSMRGSLRDTALARCTPLEEETTRE